MADRFGRFFGGLFASPVIQVKELATPNGNGKHAAAPSEAKQFSTRLSPIIGSFSPDFIPLNDRSQTIEVERGIGAYGESALLFALMRYRSVKLTEAPLWLKSETEDGEEWIEPRAMPDNLAELFDRPNPDMSMSELIGTTQLYLDVYPGVVWHKVRNRGDGPGMLYPYAEGLNLEVEPANGRLYGKFTLTHSNGEKKDYGPEDVVYFRNDHGVPPLQAALSHLKIGSQLHRAIEATLQNAITPGAAISVKEALSEEQHAQLTAIAEAKYAGVRNAGRTMVLDNGATVQQMQRKLTDLAAGDVWREQEASICAAFSVHPAIVGAIVGLENSPWSHMETAHDLFYDSFAFPTWRRFESVLNHSLLWADYDPERRYMVRFDTGKVRHLQDDVGERTEEAARAIVWTVDEARIHTGQAPLPDGDPRKELLLSELKGSSVPDPAAEFPGAEAEPPKSAPAPTEVKARDRNRATLWTLHDAVARTQESALQLITAGLLRADKSAVLYVIGGGKKQDPGRLTPEDVRELIEEARRTLKGDRLREWQETVQPWLEQIAKQAASRVAASLNISFDLLQPHVTEWVGKEMEFLAASVTETTLDAVKLALRDAVEAGEGIPWLTERLEETGAFDASRAQLIARTETTRAVNGAARESISEYSRETGRRMVKTWLSAQDDRVRDEHAEIDGEQRGIDEAFSNGRMAPDEPNCRCTLIYSAIEAI